LRRTDEAHARVLSGRCYERETTPFKLLEGLVDSLSDAVARHAPWARSALDPLASLFLGLTVDGSIEPASGHFGTTGPELRSRAVAAFRGGLAELARAGTVIVHVDDVQWCDTDGVGLLDEILDAPALPVLLVLTARDDEPTDALRALWGAAFWARTSVVDLQLAGLEHPEVVQIVREMTGDGPILDTDGIARECEGSPYFATEMARHALGRRRTGKAAPSVVSTLEDTILSRYHDLPEGARRVLAALAVSDGPRSLGLIETATDVDDVQRAIAVLRASTFVRTRSQRSTTLVEPYHDRVREEIHRSLSEAERRTLHLACARAFEALAPGACEQLLHHYEGAGEPHQAGVYARQSAERAARAHAFEQAAALYRRALQLSPWEADEERLLHERLADALAMCGHSAEAAESYDRAAATADRAHRVRLEMLASCQLLCSGNATRGLERLFQNIGYVGVSMVHGPEAGFRAVAQVETALQEATGLSYRDEAAADPDRLLRVDACWWAVKGAHYVHHDTGYFLASTHLLEAVRAGEPMRIARGAYFYAASLAAPQWESLRALADALMRLGDEAAARAPTPNVRFWREYSLAWQSIFAFDLDGVWAHVTVAREHASAGGIGLEGELGTLSILEMNVLLDRFEDPAELGHWEVWRRDALRRGDPHLSAWTSVADHGWWQTDTPEARRAELLGVLHELSAKCDDGQVLVWSVHAVLAWVERYLGLAADALARTTLVIARLRESGSWLIPRQRFTFGLEYVASAIASAVASGERVSADAQALLEDLPPQASGMINLYRAAIAHLAGDRHEALRLLDRAEAEPGKERARMVVISARVARARLIGDEASRGIVEAEFAELRRHGTADPQRFLDSFSPGFRAGPLV
jgi:tetratricopeptide (TPR) repeat protein